MTSREFAPPFSRGDRVLDDLRRTGFAVARPAFVSELATTPLAQLRELCRAWEDLPSDPHLLDPGQYRRRRHGSFVIAGAECQQASEFLEKALGQIKAEQLTGEYHTQISTSQQQQERI